MISARRIIIAASATIAIISSATWLVNVTTSHERERPVSESDQLGDIERRIEKLETAPLFEVISHQNRPLFAVYSQGARSKGKEPANVAMFFNFSGHPVAFIRAYSDGGTFDAYSDPGNLRVALESGGNTSNGFRVTEISPADENGLVPEVDRISLGEPGNTGGRKARNFSLKFLTTSDGLIAGIGESQAGTGALVIGDKFGNKRVSMQVGQDGKGIIGLFNQDNKAILTFGEAVGNTGGSLAIGDAGSEPMVKMGSNDNRYGVAVTFPVGFPYVPRSGLPGSYFLGCSVGSKTCVLP